MSRYTLFLDRHNQPPGYSDENWIVARCMDEAVEMLTLNPPDRIVFGNADFENDLVDYMIENSVRVRFGVEFLLPSTSDRCDTLMKVALPPEENNRG